MFLFLWSIIASLSLTDKSGWLNDKYDKKVVVSGKLKSNF